MRTFHNDPALKATSLARLRAHAEADEIIHGTYWEHGKGCAVGCTIEGKQTDGSYHATYETALGIPEGLARLEDYLFEHLPNGDAKQFPIQFLDAIPVGVDLAPVWPKFAFWLLMDAEHGQITYAKNSPAIKKAITRVGRLFAQEMKGKPVTSAAWRAAQSDAFAAWSAARSAAWSAAESAAWSAACAARSAAESAAWSAAESAAILQQRDMLLYFLRQAR